MPRLVSIALADFTREPLKAQHPAYEGSMFSPVAPEYTVGDVLLGSAYRTPRARRRGAEGRPGGRALTIPARLGAGDMGADGWSAVLGARGALGAPQPERQQRSDPPPAWSPSFPHSPATAPFKATRRDDAGTQDSSWTPPWRAARHPPPPARRGAGSPRHSGSTFRTRSSRGSWRTGSVGSASPRTHRSP